MAILQELRSACRISDLKWRRNARAYYNSQALDIQSLRDRTPLGISMADYGIEEDTTNAPNTNIIKSVIDTIVSKIKSIKVRPGLIPIGSVDFKLRRLLRAYRRFIDQYFLNEEVHIKSVMLFRDACVFDTGCLFVNPITYRIERLLPWQVGTILSEQQYGDLTQILIQYKDYPTTLLESYSLKPPLNKLWVTLEIYFDLNSHKITLFLDNEKVKELDYDGINPLAFIHFTNPLFGNRTTSITDELFGHQELLNDINLVINEAAQLAPGFYIVGPDTEDVQTQSISNRSGQYIGYRQGTTSSPIHFEAPLFIHPEFFTIKLEVISNAYQMIGVSELSSQALKPQGLDSGKALDTLENIEASRFQVQIDAVIKLQELIGEKVIKCFPKDIYLLPKDVNSENIKIGELQKAVKSMKFEFVALSWLSKDPQVKLQTLQQYAAAGYIPKSMVLELTEFGDVSAAYDTATLVQDAVDRVVERLVDDEEYEVPSYVQPYDLLETLLTEINQQYSISEDPSKDESLKRMGKLLDTIRDYFVVMKELTPEIKDSPADSLSDNILPEGVSPQ